MAAPSSKRPLRKRCVAASRINCTAAGPLVSVLATGSTACGSLLVKDTQMDDAFRERLSIVEQKVRTLMAVPLQTKDQIIGLIYLDSPFFIREFTVDDLNLLTVMANTAAIRTR